MTSPYFIPSWWTLRCAWCEWHIIVNNRGARNADPGAGVEASDLMRDHVEREHGKTWREFIAHDS